MVKPLRARQNLGDRFGVKITLALKVTIETSPREPGISHNVFAHHNSTAAAEQGSDFRIHANDRECFVSRMDAVASQRECLQCYATA
jgi:hypothetical protein